MVGCREATTFDRATVDQCPLLFVFSPHLLLLLLLFPIEQLLLVLPLQLARSPASRRAAERAAAAAERSNEEEARCIDGERKFFLSVSSRWSRPTLPLPVCFAVLSAAFSLCVPLRESVGREGEGPGRAKGSGERRITRVERVFFFFLLSLFRSINSILFFFSLLSLSLPPSYSQIPSPPVQLFSARLADCVTYGFFLKE